MGQSVRWVALLAPEFAEGIENIGQGGIELQCDVVVRDGAVILLLAEVAAGARQQRPEAVGGRRFLVVDHSTTTGNDLVRIGFCRSGGKTRRGGDLWVVHGLADGGERPAGRRRPPN